jgi:uncharacterized protein
MSGRVTHFEIPADDPARATAFYQQAFGWNVNPMPEMDYTLVSTVSTDERGMPSEPGAINGGIMTRKEPLSKPIITVDVDDIDAALETIGSLGGSTVFGKQAVGEMGFTAYFSDPEGNVLGLWQTAR